jgi:hypothetical protein
LGEPAGFDPPVQQQNGAVGELLHQAQVVRDEQHRDLALAQFLEFAHAAVGEHRVAHRQRFVHDQNFRVHVDRRGKRQPDVHAARIFLDRPLHELADFGERFDRRHGPVDLAAAQAHDLAVQIDVLAAGEFRVESGAQFEQRRNPPARHHAPLGRLQDAAHHLQQRALAASVRPHQPSVSPRSPSKPISRSAQKSRCAGAGPRQHLAQPVGRTLIQTVQLGNVLNQDHT